MNDNLADPTFQRLNSARQSFDPGSAADFNFGEY